MYDRVSNKMINKQIEERRTGKVIKCKSGGRNGVREVSGAGRLEQ